MKKRRKLTVRSRDNGSYLDQTGVSLYCAAVRCVRNELGRNFTIQGEIR